MTNVPDNPHQIRGQSLPTVQPHTEGSYRKALASLGIGMLRVDAEGVVLWADERARDLLQHALLDLGSTPAGEKRERLVTVGRGGKQPWEDVLEHGTATNLRCEVRDAQGRGLPVLFEGSCETGLDGTSEVMLLVRAAPAPAPPNAAYREVFEQVSDGIVVHDIETGAILDVNRRAMDLLGYEPGRAPPVSPREVAADKSPEQAEAAAFAWMLRAAKEGPQVFEWPITTPQSGTVILEVSIKRATIDGTDRLLAVVRDITSRKELERKHQASHERYRAIIEASHDIIWALDEQGRFTFVNRRGEELTGYKFSEWEGKSFMPIIHPDDLHESHVHFLEAMQGQRVHYGVRVIDTRGRVRQLQANLEPLREDGQVIGLVGLGTDITERLRLEGDLHRAQKLESLGLFAGGIAHDFNNILTAIVGSITLARRSTKKPDQRQETLEMAEKACLRARELTQQLLTFSQGGAPVRKPCSIVELLHETVDFTLRGSASRCTLLLQDDLPMVEMDAGQMGQVLNNLLLNAVQAMPGGGVITLRADELVVEQDGDGPLSLPEGCYVHMSVSDEGDGIPAEHIPNIFDPYFTTKATGTGLGLATCYSIVKRHEGEISVETRVGKGTTFHLYLPSTRRAREPSNEPPIPGSQRGGRVLLMDDDAMVRDVGLEMLQLLGFDAVAVSDGQAAIAAVQEAMEAGKRFDVVILDLTVPRGMGGLEAAGILRKIDPQVRLLASSGYSTDAVMADHESHGFDAVVAKPYVPEDLDRAMGSAFHEPR